MRKLAAIAAAAGLAAILSGAAGYAVHGAQAAPRPAVCRFDGGGTLTAGDAARTTDGRTWLCTEDSQLVRIG